MMDKKQAGAAWRGPMFPGKAGWVVLAAAAVPFVARAAKPIAKAISKGLILAGEKLQGIADEPEPQAKSATDSPKPAEKTASQITSEPAPNRAKAARSTSKPKPATKVSTKKTVNAKAQKKKSSPKPKTVNKKIGSLDDMELG